ncbi:MAG: hypothetical protein L3J05_06635, partial [Robiginitomaculum sp.]|nr:hypothetical protein [Robiginitomaculum sp.]
APMAKLTAMVERPEAVQDVANDGAEKMDERASGAEKMAGEVVEGIVEDIVEKVPAKSGQ